MRRIICYFTLLLTFRVDALPLFDVFAELKTTVPYVQLANLPTPVQHYDQLSIFIKRDDLAGFENLYGGNKVRKLEFLLAEALQCKASKVITFGAAGTNHGLATACYANKLRLPCLLMLTNQPNSLVVQQNMLLDYYFQAEMRLFNSSEQRRAALEQEQQSDPAAYFIPTGGSNALGAIGFVSAAFELKEQVAQGLLPMPDRIYVPVGSAGTTAGLLLGLQLAQIKSKLVAVAVEPEGRLGKNIERIQRLFHETNQLLHNYSSTIPLLSFPVDQLALNQKFEGERYGLWLSETSAAASLVQKMTGISLEGTYSAKAAAAVIQDAQSGEFAGQTLLFWNTFCGLDFSQLTSQIDYKQLNPALHKYFETRNFLRTSM